MTMKNKRIEEPRLESVVAWLSEKDGAESIKQDIRKLYDTLYYFNPNEVEPFHEMVKRQKREFPVIFKNLMQLYPLSTSIVLKMMEEDLHAADEVLRLYDIDNVLALEWTRLISNIRTHSALIPSRVNEIEQKMKFYEQQKQNHLKAIEDFKKTDSNYKALMDSEAKLQRERLELEETQGKLEKSKIELVTTQNEKQILQEQYDKSMRQIKEIETDLRKIHSENEVFLKALKLLSEVAKTLPNSEVE